MNNITFIYYLYLFSVYKIIINYLKNEFFYIFKRLYKIILRMKIEISENNKKNIKKPNQNITR